MLVVHQYIMYDIIVFENVRFFRSHANKKPAFSKIFTLESVFGGRKRRSRVNERLKWRKKSLFSKLSGYVSNRPQCFFGEGRVNDKDLVLPTELIRKIGYLKGEASQPMLTVKTISKFRANLFLFVCLTHSPLKSLLPLVTSPTRFKGQGKLCQLTCTGRRDHSNHTIMTVIRSCRPQKKTKKYVTLTRKFP